MHTNLANELSDNSHLITQRNQKFKIEARDIALRNFIKSGSSLTGLV
jgi:hypothetical protein